MRTIMLKKINCSLSRLLEFKTPDVKVTHTSNFDEYMIYINHPLTKSLQISLNILNQEGVRFVSLTVNSLIDNLEIANEDDNKDLLDDLKQLKEFIDSFLNTEGVKVLFHKAMSGGDYLC